MLLLSLASSGVSSFQSTSYRSWSGCMRTARSSKSWRRSSWTLMWIPTWLVALLTWIKPKESGLTWKLSVNLIAWSVHCFSCKQAIAQITNKQGAHRYLECYSETWRPKKLWLSRTSWWEGQTSATKYAELLSKTSNCLETQTSTASMRSSNRRSTLAISYFGFLACFYGGRNSQVESSTRISILHTFSTSLSS